MKSAKNRFDQFFAIINEYYRELFYLSLLIFIFVLPYFIFKFFAGVVDTELLNEIANASIEESNALIILFKRHELINAIISATLIGVSFIGICSGVNILKKLIYQTPTSLKSDYFSYIKMNLLKSFIIGFIYGIMVELMMISSFFDGTFINEAIGILIIILISIYFMYYINLDTYYTDTFIHRIYNAFILLVLRLPINLLISVFSFCFIFVFYVFNGLTALFFVALYLALFGLGLILLAYSVNAVASFDKFINKDNYPEIYKKGLDTHGEENKESIL